MSGEGAGPEVNAYRSQLCSSCIRIEFTFLEQYVDLGTIQEISNRSSKCLMCAYLIQLLVVERIRSITPQRATPDSGFNRYRFSGGGIGSLKLYSLVKPHVISVFSETKRSRGHEFVIACNHVPRVRVKTDETGLEFLNRAETPVTGVGMFNKTLPNRNIDFNVLKRWLSDCETAHDLTSDNTKQQEDAVDIFLMDVTNKCLTKANTTHKYVALSYVMGGVVGIQATKSTIHSLTQPAAFGDLTDNMPTVIRDAIEATIHLGIQYLWIDSLCIIQDDPVTKHRQISQMDVIYSHAYVTLVSVSGINSNCGIPGVQLESRPRIVLSHEYRARLGNTDRCIQFVASPPSLDEVLADSTYETRGWTFQERFLSRRLLYFTNWQVHYECRAGCETCETESNSNNDSNSSDHDDGLSELQGEANDGDKGEHQDEAEGDKPAETMEQDLPYAHPEVFQNYASSVERYTSRQLTFPSDVLNAFQGVMNALSKSKEGAQQFICGLPEEFFDIALLWIPSERNYRRDVKLVGGVNFPTWSWAGWVGPVSYSFMIQGGYLRDYFKSEVEWVSKSIGAPTRHTLRFWAFTAPLKAFGYSGGSRRVDFHLRAADQPALYITDSQGRHCGVFLDFRDIIQSRSSRRRSRQRSALLNAGNRIQSLLTLHHDEIEIVLLSKTALANVTDMFDRTGFELRLPERHGKVWLKTFKYKAFRQEPLERCVANVMWIRWKDGMAERIAIGAVHEDAWAAVQGNRKLINLV